MPAPLDASPDTGVDLSPGKFLPGYFPTAWLGLFTPVTARCRTPKVPICSAAEESAQGAFRIMTGRYSLCGEGLCIGNDSGDAVSSEYRPKFPSRAAASSRS